MKEILNQHEYSSVNAGSPEPGGHLTSLCSQDHKQCIQHEPSISLCPPREQAAGIYGFLITPRGFKIAGKCPR